MTQGEQAILPSYTEATHACVVLSAEAADLADRARGFVPIGKYELQSDGTELTCGQ